ncbi:hypothetical protein ACJ72_06451 [Emergomyces africanus]|uniref:Uncharacterized protein n=1 Tax=Emergomyces africanus TaxID=1955775 RepID=A0A1B7NQZ4_9EURO|nr:hypothetical protein ACJ72_06451 [Emergomyces africanus]
MGPQGLLSTADYKHQYLSSRPPATSCHSREVSDASHNRPAFPVASLGPLIVRLCTQADAQLHQGQLPSNAKTAHCIPQ